MKKRFCAVCGKEVPYNSGFFVFHAGTNRLVCGDCNDKKEKG